MIVSTSDYKRTLSPMSGNDADPAALRSPASIMVSG